MKYYHVTPKQNLESIMKDGLVKGRFAGIFLFDVNKDHQMSIRETARELAKQLIRIRPTETFEFEEQWCLLEVDSTGYDEKISIDPFIRMGFDWFDIHWNQYEVDTDRISPDNIKFVEEFTVIRPLYDAFEAWGHMIINMSDLILIENLKSLTAYIEDGTFEKALQLDYKGNLRRQALELRDKIMSQLPDDPHARKLLDIAALSKYVEIENQADDFNLETIKSMNLAISQNSNMNFKKLKEFVNHESNSEKRKSVHHGLQHWMTVELFGVLMCRLTEDADEDVIRWFAYLHDSQRENDGRDYIHGEKAARYIENIRQTFLSDLTDEQILKLTTACRLHTDTLKTDDPTVNICFDADRFDLLRVGTVTDPSRLASRIGVSLLRYPYEYLIDLAKDKVGKDCMVTKL